MRKNKGTIEVKTDRRLYVIDFLNDKILSNGKELKRLPSDVLQFYFKCCHSRAYDKETVLLALLVHSVNDNFKNYREVESFISIAIQNLDLEYRVDLDDMCGLKLTKDYLNWCREHDEFVSLRTTQEYYQEKLEDSIPKELKPYFVMLKDYAITENIDKETLFKLLKILKYTVYHLITDEALDDIKEIGELVDVLTTDENKKLLNTNRTVSQNYRIIEQQEFVGNKAFENTLRKLNFLNGKCFDDYVVVVPQNVMDLVDEGIQQNNCVGYYYNDSIENGDNCIFFLRKKDKPEKSYITCRYFVDNKKVVEARYKNNHDIDSADEDIVYRINDFINDNL